MAEQEGFEPSIRGYRIHTFQACAFDHSATAPHSRSGGHALARQQPRQEGAPLAGLRVRRKRTNDAGSGTAGLVGEFAAHPVAPVLELLEILVNVRVRNRSGKRVADQILLADVGDVIALVAFGEQVVERLVAIGPDVLGDRLIPVLAIREDRIDVEDHAAKVERLVSDHVADGEAREDAAGRLESAAGLCGEKRCPVHE